VFELRIIDHEETRTWIVNNVINHNKIDDIMII